MLSGGGDREWLIRQKPDGTRNQDARGHRVVGNHRGFYTGLNVANPQPGCRYQWCSRDARDVYLAKLRGWEVVVDTDPDSPAYKAGLNGGDYQIASNVDTANVFQDSVFMRTTEANYRRLQNERKHRARMMMEDNSDEFLQGASPQELATGNTTRGQLPTRLARTDHVIVRREGGQIRDQIRPQGIMKD